MKWCVIYSTKVKSGEVFVPGDAQMSFREVMKTAKLIRARFVAAKIPLLEMWLVLRVK